ncbi:MAG: DNA polymerase I [Lachnospiraceae bacterium]|nr:DNA polymerase I [Lachnospiraceae bacterium]
MEKVLLIDGHSIVNRAFYGVPFLSDSAGRPTNAVYGFLNILFKLLDDERPAFLAVAFDVRQKTFRHEIYPEYKGTRKPMPPELHEQVEMVRELLRAMNVCVMELPGFEADDVIGTMAAREKDAGRQVTIVSGDRDLLQLADEETCVKIPSTSRGQTTVKDYYPEDVREKYGVSPTEFIDVKALMGDSSDNITGVPGIGEKGATALIAQWHSIENAYEHIEEIEPKRTREALRAGWDSAVFSKKLVTIVTDAPVDPDWLDCALGRIYTPEAYELVKGYELKAIAARFAAGMEEVRPPERDSGDAPRAILRVGADISADEALGEVLRAEVCGLSAVYAAEHYENGREEGLKALFFTADGRKIFLAEIGAVQAALKILAEAKHVGVFGFKRLLRALPEEAADRAAALPVDASYMAGADDPEGEDLPPVIDLSVASYLLNPIRNSYEADDIAADILGETIPSRAERLGKKDAAEAFAEGDEAASGWFADQASLACRAAVPAFEMLKQAGEARLYTRIELPLTVTLARMEAEGIRANREQLAEYAASLSVRIAELEREIYEMAGGMPFNINSPKQLGEILFERMGIPGGKKTKTGWSTAAEVLEKLAPDWPIVDKILEFRTCSKLKSTYAEGLAAFICPDGRIRSKFHQTVTATGRLSSSDPNLQNIPVRIELGRQIRKVFTAAEGCRFVDADYSQIELRVLAHLSGDENLIEAYNQAQDIHAITASKVFHVPLEEVTPALRRNAKAVNFGIVYGISAFGLSNDLSISRKEAVAYIDQYFLTYPKVKAFLDRTVAEAKERGYTVTMSGRRRPIPELKSSNFMTRSFGERAAMNSPVQGTAADVIKVAMNRVDRRLRREIPEAKMILQVHDELMVEAPEEAVPAVAAMLAEEMPAALPLAVKLEADVHDGRSWDECK